MTDSIIAGAMAGVAIAFIVVLPAMLIFAACKAATEWLLDEYRHRGWLRSPHVETPGYIRGGLAPLMAKGIAELFEERAE